MAQPYQSRVGACSCGTTMIELVGDPIQSVICYCQSCRAAGQAFEQDLGARGTVSEDGGVAYCLYRKDRVRISQGADKLQEYRLEPRSPTRRLVASCCGSPMFLDFTPGHWLTVFRNCIAAQAPEPQYRIMTRDKPAGAVMAAGIPAFATRPPRLMIKLLAAWAAMGFRRPEVTW